MLASWNVSATYTDVVNRASRRDTARYFPSGERERAETGASRFDTVRRGPEGGREGGREEEKEEQEEEREEEAEEAWSLAVSSTALLGTCAACAACVRSLANW